MGYNSPAPNVGSPFDTSFPFHVSSNQEVFRPMISTHSARQAMFCDNIGEQVQDSLGTIVSARSDTGDKSREAIDECVNYNLPPNKTYVVR